MALPPDDSAMSRTQLKLTPTARIPHLQNLPHQHHRSQCHHEPVPPSPVHQCGRCSCTSRVDAIDVRNFPALKAAIGEGFVKTFHSETVGQLTLAVAVITGGGLRVEVPKEGMSSISASARPAVKISPASSSNLFVNAMRYAKGSDQTMLTAARKLKDLTHADVVPEPETKKCEIRSQQPENCSLPS